LIINQKFDFIFLALHGTFGEDGYIQKILEENKIKYNGSNSTSSMKCFNKNSTKSIANNYNILTPVWNIVDFPDNKIDYNYIMSKANVVLDLHKDYHGEEDRFFVVKPINEGSSIGVSVVRDHSNLPSVIDKTIQYGDLIIEKYIDGREITVSILGSKSLPVIEIKPHSNVYDYRSKYTSGESDYICPAEIDEALTEKIQETALKVHNLLGCEVYSRVDFRLNKNNEFFLLEINTLPGMTETSLFPMAANAVGLSFEDLIDKIIKLSLEK